MAIEKVIIKNFKKYIGARLREGKLLVKSSARTATRNKRTWRLSANGSS